eukprot:1254645-Amphidinium_carterae.1
MPAPKPEMTEEDATRVPVPDEGSRTGNTAVTGAESQPTVQSSSASAPFLAHVPVQHVPVQGP